MADESGNEFQDRQSHGFCDISVMVKVLIGNRFPIVVFDTGFTNRGTFEIFAKVVNIGFHGI